MNNELYHHGVLGMKWGVRRYQPYGEGGYIPKGKTVNKNTSNSSASVIKKGTKFNRVGEYKFNDSGALYVSQSENDLNRYIKNLGPSTLGKLFNTAANKVQKIEVTGDLKVPSQEDNTRIILESLKDPELAKTFNDSIYSWSYATDDDFDALKEVPSLLKDLNGKNAQKLAYAVNTFFGDPNYSKETKQIYDNFRKEGYDALSDIHDVLSGTSETPYIILNPNKVKVTETQMITKESYRQAKQFVKSIEKLKVSDIIK